jgi:cyclophilin family peptidyl-prolyl cis-trans isomerase
LRLYTCTETNASSLCKLHWPEEKHKNSEREKKKKKKIVKKKMRVFLDIDVGDRAAHEAHAEAHARAAAFLSENGPAMGLGADIGALDDEGRELLAELYGADPAWVARGACMPAAPTPLRAGRLVIELNAGAAPKACENFAALCAGDRGKDKGTGAALALRGTRFHRIEPKLAQGGDITRGDGSGGASIWGRAFKDEPAALKLKHDARGVVSMANSGRNSNTSQFFITLDAAGMPHCDGKHVVLGRAVAGAETDAVLDAIASQAAAADGEPRCDVVIADCGVLPGA